MEIPTSKRSLSPAGIAEFPRAGSSRGALTVISRRPGKRIDDYQTRNPRNPCAEHGNSILRHFILDFDIFGKRERSKQMKDLHLFGGYKEKRT